MLSLGVRKPNGLKSVTEFSPVKLWTVSYVSTTLLFVHKAVPQTVLGSPATLALRSGTLAGACLARDHLGPSESFFFAPARGQLVQHSDPCARLRLSWVIIACGGIRERLGILGRARLPAWELLSGGGILGKVSTLYNAGLMELSQLD